MKKYYATLNDKNYEIEIHEGTNQAIINGKTYNVDQQSFSEDGFHSFLIDHVPCEAVISRDGDDTVVYLGHQQYRVSILDEQKHRLDQMGIKTSQASGKQIIKAPMPGLVVKILAQKGDAVAAGGSLLLIEAMKMENEIKAVHAGIVAEIHVTEKQTVDQGTPLVTIE